MVSWCLGIDFSAARASITLLAHSVYEPRTIKRKCSFISQASCCYFAPYLFQIIRVLLDNVRCPVFFAYPPSSLFFPNSGEQSALSLETPALHHPWLQNVDVDVKAPTHRCYENRNTKRCGAPSGSLPLALSFQTCPSLLVSQC